MIETRRAWEGGPLRQFSQISESGFIPHYKGAERDCYVGSYVCSACQKVTAGVYFKHGQWVCSPCLSTIKPPIKQAQEAARRPVCAVADAPPIPGGQRLRIRIRSDR